MTSYRRSDDTAGDAGDLFFGAKQSNPNVIIIHIMKHITPLAVLAAVTLALTACDTKTADAVKEKAEDAKEVVETKTEEATAAADKKIDEAKEAAKEAAPAAAAAVDSMAEKAKDATQNATDATKEAADKAVDKVKDAAGNAMDSATGAAPADATTPAPTP